MHANLLYGSLPLALRDVANSRPFPLPKMAQVAIEQYRTADTSQ